MLHTSQKHLLTLWDDETRVDITRLNELEYWTYKWKISTFQLFEAIEKTRSNLVSAIEAYLKDKRLI